jgi:hypothetical protein
MEKIKDVNQGDLLTFITSENKFRILLCTSVNKDRSPQNFTFCILDYKKVEKPVINNIKNLSFFGVGSMTAKNHYNYSDQELEKMWFFHPEIKPCLIGSFGFIIWRKDFMKFRENFEFIGNLEILSNIDKNGNSGINASSWNFLKNFLDERLNNLMNEKEQKLFQLKAITKTF